MAYRTYYRWGALLALAAAPACVDGSKIDKTNSTMEMNLEELRTLNRNFVQAADTLARLGRPMETMASRFDRLIAVFERSAEVGVQASEEALRLMSAIDPTQVLLFADRIDQMSAHLADFNRLLAERGGGFEKLLGQLESSGRMIVRMGDLLGLLPAEEREALSAPAADVARSTVDLAGVVRDETEKTLARAGDILSRGVTPEGKGRPNVIAELRRGSDQLELLNRRTERLSSLLEGVQIRRLGENAEAMAAAVSAIGRIDVDKLVSETLPELRGAVKDLAEVKERLASLRGPWKKILFADPME